MNKPTVACQHCSDWRYDSSNRLVSLRRLNVNLNTVLLNCPTSYMTKEELSILKDPLQLL